MLQSKNAELESVLDYLCAQPEEIDVDEAVQATNPLYNQSVKLSLLEKRIFARRSGNFHVKEFRKINFRVENIHRNNPLPY